MIYMFPGVIIDPSAIGEGTAEYFETGIGKLATASNIDDVPAFEVDQALDLKITELQNYGIFVKRGSQGVNPGTGGYFFSLYIGTVGVEPADGVFKADLSVHA